MMPAEEEILRRRRGEKNKKLASYNFARCWRLASLAQIKTHYFLEILGNLCNFNYQLRCFYYWLYGFPEELWQSPRCSPSRWQYAENSRINADDNIYTSRFKIRRSLYTLVSLAF